LPAFKPPDYYFTNEIFIRELLMSSLTSQIEAVESNLERLKRRMPEVPVAQILTSRALVTIGRELANMLDQRLRPFGLSDVEFRALINIYSLQDIAAYPGDLCVSLGHSPANITRITDNLVERGLLARVADERDRRRLLLTITASGEALMQQLLPVMCKAKSDSYRGFGDADVEQLLRSLKHLAQTLDAATARANASDNEAMP
jgi:MarR family transcriptional regulator, negative regulator of the multidrug operon emrRAB